MADISGKRKKKKKRITGDSVREGNFHRTLLSREKRFLSMEVDLFLNLTEKLNARASFSVDTTATVIIIAAL